MASLNSVLLIGNLTRDPELRYTTKGAAMGSFSLATSHKWKGGQGETKEEVTFIKVVVWGKAAENCGKYLAKGSPVFVEGRLQQNNWETDKGEKRSQMQVVAKNVQFLGRGSGSRDTEDDQGSVDDDDNIPF